MIQQDIQSKVSVTMYSLWDQQKAFYGDFYQEEWKEMQITHCFMTIQDDNLFQTILVALLLKESDKRKTNHVTRNPFCLHLKKLNPFLSLHQFWV